MENKLEIFTAKQIARALGCSRQNIHQQLAGIASDGEKIVAGNLAKGWKLETFPPSMLRRLSDKAEAKRYRSVAGLLREPFPRYESPVPISQIAPASIDRARKLRDALHGAIEQRNDSAISTVELARRGVDAYRRAVGHRITASHWRTLLDRTIERDGGANEWQRLDLYIEEKPPRISTSLPISQAREHRFDVLEDALNAVAGADRLTTKQRDFVWTKACDELQLQIAARQKAKRIKCLIVAVLSKSGLLGTSSVGVSKTLNRKWVRYCSTDGRVTDGRSIRYARERAVLPETDARKLIAAALERGGGVSQAWRETQLAGELSDATNTRYIGDPSSKSYVPRAVRDAITPELNRLRNIHRGPRAHALLGAFIKRDYSKLYAGDSYQADDCTCPVYYWEADDSRFGYRIIRGQLILMIDERSLRCLGFALHSANNYNARIIRALITRVHDGFGLPRRRFYFERGIWRESKILTGEKALPGGEILGLSHTELGLREFGVKFCHAKLPRGKVIERVFGILQNSMESLPGYAGREERHELSEVLKKQLNDARSGHIHPRDFLFEKSQWENQLHKLLATFNSQRQQGSILKGLSPNDAWDRFQSSEGLVYLGEQARYRLAHHKLTRKVRRDGVTITLPPGLGGASYTYLGEATGRFAGQSVLVWFNPEEPDYIAITSLDEKTGPFIAARSEALPAIDATPDQFARAQAQVDAHNGHAITSYGLIAPQLGRRKFRQLILDNHTVEVGERLRIGAEKAKTARQKVRSNVRKIANRSRELGIRVAIDSETAERTATGVELMAEALEDSDSQKGS